MQEVVGIKGYYVGKDGSVYSTKRGGLVQLHPSNHSEGYKVVRLTLAPRLHKLFYVHVLVAKAFIPNPEGLPEVDHLNGDRSDNRVGNLRWASRAMQSFNLKPKSNGLPRGVTTRLTSKGVLRYRAVCAIGKRTGGSVKFLGSYDTLEEAAKAYVEYAVARGATARHVGDSG